MESVASTFYEVWPCISSKIVGIFREMFIFWKFKQFGMIFNAAILQNNFSKNFHFFKIDAERSKIPRLWNAKTESTKKKKIFLDSKLTMTMSNASNDNLNFTKSFEFRLHLEIEKMLNEWQFDICLKFFGMHFFKIQTVAGRLKSHDDVICYTSQNGQSKISW